VPDLLLDIETFSPVDLKKYGAYAYAAHPDFQILMCGWRRSDSRRPAQVFIGSDIDDIPGLWDPSVRKVAWNAQFERVCFSAHRLKPTYFLDPAEWHDTASVAVEYGYPAKLAHTARALGVEAKDEAGTALINYFCKPISVGARKGQRRTPEDDPVKWAQFVEYCRQDVVVLGQVHADLPEFPNAHEAELYVVDQHINDRGLRIDVQQARAGVRAASENKLLQLSEFTELTGVENPASRPQVMRWAEATGLDLPNLQAETVEELLSGDLSPVHRRAMELRQELALVAYKKYATALASLSGDDRLRGGFRFFGAHTGRWAGKGVQPHNMPRASYMDEEGKWDEVAQSAALLDLVELGLGADALDLKKLVRALFVGPFTIVDYNAIEARVIAWLAGEEWVLKAFRMHRDIYVEQAKKIGPQYARKDGKVAVLALGFQGAVNSLRVMGATGSDQELKRIVDLYRETNPNIKRLWADLGDAFRAGGRAGTRLEIVADGKDRAMVLPSGRALVYRNVSSRVVQGPYGPRTRASFEVWKNGRKYRQDTYGGKLAENATQAVARDYLGEGLVRLHNSGYSVVGHVHDEVIVEGTDDLRTIKSLLTETPAWAEGLPMAAEGFVTDRYRKG
jgi:DNA polymerase bacteriophage-type